MNKVGLLLVLGGLMMAISYLPTSHAWTSLAVNRSPGALLAADSTAGLVLNGFQNTPYTLTANYSATGTIRPQAGGSSNIGISIAPVISQACSRIVGQGNCTNGDWTLDFCLATTTASVGTTTCLNGSSVSFSGTGAGTPNPAGINAIAAASNQTLYLLAKGTISGTHNTRLACGDWSMAITSTTSSGLTSSLFHSTAETPRRGIIRIGSGCP